MSIAVRHQIAIAGIADDTSEHIVRLLRRSGYSVTAPECRNTQDLQAALSGAGDALLLDAESLPFDWRDCEESIIVACTQKPLIFLNSDGNPPQQTDSFRATASRLSPENVLNRCERELEIIDLRKECELARVREQEALACAHTLTQSDGVATAWLEDGLIFNCNDRFATIMGEHDRFGIQYHSIVDYIRGDDTALISDAVMKATLERTPVKLGAKIRNALGEIYSVRVQLQPVVYEGEECLMCCLIEEPVAPAQPATARGAALAQAEIHSDEDAVAALIRQDCLGVRYLPMIALSQSLVHHFEVDCALDLPSAEIPDIESLQQFVGQGGGDSRVDRWLLEHCLAQASAAELQGRSLHLVVNIGLGAVNDNQFPTWLLKILEKSGFPPGSLSLQLPWQLIHDHSAECESFSHKLRRIGCQLAVNQAIGDADAIDTLETFKPFFVQVYVDPKWEDRKGHLKEFISFAREYRARVIIPGVRQAAELAMMWQLAPDLVSGSYLAEAGPDMNYDFSSFA